MNEALEQLKQLVFDGGWDNESRQQVINFEQQLADLAVKEQLAEHPVIKQYIEWLTERVAQAELLLKTDRTLNERGRDALFERIDDCEHLLSIFTGRERAGIEKSIRDALTRAKVS
jgi:hypothetical protein